MKTTLKITKPPKPPLRKLSGRVVQIADLGEQERQQSERRRSYAARATNQRVTGSNRYVPEGYDGAELRPYVGRPDAGVALALPSRTGSRLRYPDGRITDLAGNAIQEAA